MQSIIQATRSLVNENPHLTRVVATSSPQAGQSQDVHTQHTGAANQSRVECYLPVNGSDLIFHGERPKRFTCEECGELITDGAIFCQLGEEDWKAPTVLFNGKRCRRQPDWAAFHRKHDPRTKPWLPEDMVRRRLVEHGVVRQK